MSDPIAVRLGDELRDRFDSYHESRSGDYKESDTFRYLLDEGLRAEELPLYNRLGVEDREGEPNPVGAQLEAAREPTESQEDVVRRFLAEAVEARQADVLDELEIDDELRDRVERAREEGETLDDAVRRLLRVGVESAEEGQNRLTAAAVVFFIGGVPAALASIGEANSAVGIVLALTIWILLGDVIDRTVGGASSALKRVRNRIGL